MQSTLLLRRSHSRSTCFLICRKPWVPASWMTHRAPGECSQSRRPLCPESPPRALCLGKDSDLCEALHGPLWWSMPVLQGGPSLPEIAFLRRDPTKPSDHPLMCSRFYICPAPPGVPAAALGTGEPKLNRTCLQKAQGSPNT